MSQGHERKERSSEIEEPKESETRERRPMPGRRSKKGADVSYASDWERGVNNIWPEPERKNNMTEPKYPITDEDREDFRRRFKYHAPKGDQSLRYVEIRDDGKDLAELFYGNCPASRERSLALTHLEQAIMWASAAIARNE